MIKKAMEDVMMQNQLSSFLGQRKLEQGHKLAMLLKQSTTKSNKVQTDVATRMVRNRIEET